jgi:hypothetical protein
MSLLPSNKLARTKEEAPMWRAIMRSRQPPRPADLDFHEILRAAGPNWQFWQLPILLGKRIPNGSSKKEPDAPYLERPGLPR